MIEKVDFCSRSVYRITYSQGDKAKVSCRNCSEIVINTLTEMEWYS